jgi:hypothetical protein
MRSLVLLAFSLVLSCVTTKNYGQGPCTEYKPLCMLQGSLYCERDARGCEICTCR